MDDRECIASEDLRCRSAAAAPDEEEIPLDREEKKKLRRVSFADELTSVHIFQRDDDGSDQTPVDDNPKPNCSPPPKTEDENDDEQKKFVLDFPSTSPGSDFGSASTSHNDDGDGWFGKVSASFIRGHLSASAVSDDSNYETTLDSTDFKLHFQNLNQSDMESDFKTPTRSHLSLECRMPSTGDFTGTNSTGNLMFGVHKPTPAVSISGGTSSGAGDDMSLIDENRRIYDYGILSHTLEAMMSESRNILYGISAPGCVKIPKSSNLEDVNNGLKTCDELKSHVIGLEEMGGNELESTNPLDPPSEVVSNSDVNHKGNDRFASSIIDRFITSTAHSLPDAAAVQAHQSLILSESTSAMLQNMPSAIDQDSAKAAVVVVGGSTVEFGGGSESLDQQFVFGDGTKSSDPLSSPRETNLMHVTTQSDCRDAGNVEHKMTEDSLSNARCTTEIGFKITNQSSKPEGSVSSSYLKQQRIFHPSIFLTVSESPLLHVESRMNGNSWNDTRCTPEIGYKTNQSSKSPLEGSVSLLSAKRQKMFHPTSSAGQQPSSPLNNGSMDSSAILSMDCSSQHVSIGRALEVDRNLVKTTGDDRNTDPNKIHVSLADSGEELGSVSQENKDVGETTRMKTDAEGSSPPRIFRNSKENEYIVHNGVLKDQISAGISFCRRDMQMDFVTTKACVTPLRVLSPLNSQWGSPESNFFSRTYPARLTERVSENISSDGPAFTCARKRTATPTNLVKRLMEWWPEGPSTQDTNISSEIIGGEKVPSSLSLLTSVSVQEAENSEHKQRLERANFMDKEDKEIVKIQKSPKVAPVSEIMILFSNRCIEKISEVKMDGDLLTRDLDHVFYEFSEAMKHQMLPLAENLNPRQVSDLEDIFGRLEKANKYKVICNQIQSQEIHNHDVNLQQNRVVEARQLQQMLVYKQAKLQLLRLRQERLRKKYQLLRSGIQETKLISESFANHCKPGRRGVQLKDSHVTSVLVDQNSKNTFTQEERQKVDAKRQELGSLANKVKELIQSLIFSYKIKGEPSSNDVIVLVNEQLKTKSANRFVHQYLQLWEVVDLEKKNLQYNLKLNYLGFLHQRFIITVGPVARIIVTNKLIEANIKKSYPIINACVAFAYVFNAECSRDLGSSKNLALETHLTSLLLDNLLDVVEEALTVKIELSNLIKTSFNSPSADQLDLQLQFLDCKTGHIVTLTLDMTCLKQGIYPMEILPSQVQSQSPVSQLRSAEILSAVRTLKPDHSRILRLCRCVSQVLRNHK
ncbi:uncharacterized protein LOC113281415 isoform X1 [Papaver somniferum]|uniref:uncharacterized protein LOC113281415 isoform X1 n=1 Tax=Papaver somniferum TaxID=3469 RepID=UPI000E6FAF43|nr:uncharacterized protein LOC113281415 isoform X1 [Papaver somniferum]